MAISKITLNGVTQMDVTQKTVTANKMLNGATALKNDGTDITGNIASKTSSDLTVNGATVTAPAGYYESDASKSVAAGTAGTPTATKGSVSNHSVSVTPSVTNSTGYITGGTKTGTAVTVSASELVSGNLEITENGEDIDVTNYATVSVDVAGSGGGGVNGVIYQDPEGYLVLENYGNGNRSMKDPIRFFDYNGEIVASYTSVPTKLPTVPSHEGLKNGTWNYTLQQITTQFAASGTCDIGPNYMTTSEKTEINIEFVDDARLSPYLRFAVNGTVTIDWGDGSATEDVTGTSLTTRIDRQHTYSQAGSYTITLTDTSGAYAMYGDGQTYTLLHNNSGTSNANRVYSNCVKTVRIGKNCSIGNTAFYGCSSLFSITIPSGVMSIGTSAFNNCYSLSSITIPSGVTSIGSTAFYYCSSLSSVTIPSGVTSIETNAFSSCYSLSSVTIPSGVTSIKSQAFSSCYSLSSITIPSGVTSIGTSTFYYCSSLSSVTIPSGVTSIKSQAFQNGYSLSSITIPSGVTSIESTAFATCHSLSSVTIPSSVTSIGNSAFSGCYGMKEYHFEPTTPPTLGTTAFNNIQSDCIIYVPRSTNQTVLNAYKTATNWSDYVSYMQEEPA